jgi:hypothetical protein
MSGLLEVSSQSSHVGCCSNHKDCLLKRLYCVRRGDTRIAPAPVIPNSRFFVAETPDFSFRSSLIEGYWEAKTTQIRSEFILLTLARKLKEDHLFEVSYSVFANFCEFMNKFYLQE